MQQDVIRRGNKEACLRLGFECSVRREMIRIILYDMTQRNLSCSKRNLTHIAQKKRVAKASKSLQDITDRDVSPGCHSPRKQLWNQTE